MTNRPWMQAHDHKRDVRREVIEAVLFVLVLVLVVAAMSLDYRP